MRESDSDSYSDSCLAGAAGESAVEVGSGGSGGSGVDGADMLEGGVEGGSEVGVAGGGAEDVWRHLVGDNSEFTGESIDVIFGRRLAVPRGVWRRQENGGVHADHSDHSEKTEIKKGAESGAESGAETVVEMGAEMGVAEGGDCLGIARFGFNDLCAKPLGSTDYAALAEVSSLTVVNAW